MNKKNLPNIPLYIGDWEKDCNVLSLETEAAWLRIIFKMFTNGKQSSYKIPTKGLQNLWKCGAEKVLEIIGELEDYNICEINTDGRFIEFTCRRYAKENGISKIRSEAVSNRKDRKKGKKSNNKTSTKHLQNTENENENEDVNEIEVKDEYVIKKEEKEKIEFQEIVDIFNSVCTNLPDVQKLTQKRKSAISSRIRDYDLNKIGEVFQMVSLSDFLNGDNDRGWTADFDWVMNPNNFIKILEGKYNKQNGKTSKNGGATSEYRRKIAERFGKVQSN